MSSSTALLIASSLALVLACGSDEPIRPTAEPPAAAPAQPDGTAQDTHAEMNHGDAAHEAGSAEAPADLASAWAALQGTRDAIASDVASGALGGIHAKSEGLEPSAKAVLDHSSDLSADQRARVDSARKQIAAVAGKLHDAADAGDAEGASAALKQLDAVLELMRAQYPAGALDPGESHAQHSPASHDHGAASHLPGHDHGTRPLAAVDVEAQETIVIRATEFAFEPATLELRAGVATRIELDNRGALVEHSLLVRAPSGGDLIHLHAGPKGTDAGTYRLDAPGTYDVLCTIPGHTEAGMIGKLVVL